MSHDILLSLALNVFVWAFASSFMYIVIFVWFRYSQRIEMNRFKFNPSYPTGNTLRKEMSFSALAIVICSLMESVIIYVKQRQSADWVDTDGDWPDSLTDFLTNILCLRTVYMLLWVDAHFYFCHVAMHKIPGVYAAIHKLHHESVNPNPFSGLSFHPVESVIYFSSLCCAFFWPMPRWVFAMYKFGVILAPLNGHLGHGETPEAEIGMCGVFIDSFNHYIHHSMFNYNYGSGLLPIWDNLLGTQYPVSQLEHLRKYRKSKKSSRRSASGY